MAHKSQTADLKKLADRIRQIESDDLPSLYDLDKPLDQVLWVLTTIRYALESQAYFSVTDLVSVLKNLDIAATEGSVRNALARAGNKIDRIGSGQLARFKIAFPGKAHLAQQKVPRGIHLLYLDGTKPRSDRQLFLKELGEQLKGEILILHKFLGSESLDLLEKFAPSSSVRMLSAKITGKGNSFHRELKRFLRELPNFRFRLYPQPADLHDRYLLTKRDLFILGHGIKDLASKESFVVVLRDAVGKELREDLRAKFNQRWNRSKPLP